MGVEVTCEIFNLSKSAWYSGFVDGILRLSNRRENSLSDMKGELIQNGERY